MCAEFQFHSSNAFYTFGSFFYLAWLLSSASSSATTTEDTILKTAIETVYVVAVLQYIGMAMAVNQYGFMVCTAIYTFNQLINQRVSAFALVFTFIKRHPGHSVFLFRQKLLCCAPSHRFFIWMYQKSLGSMFTFCLSERFGISYTKTTLHFRLALKYYI